MILRQEELMIFVPKMDKTFHIVHWTAIYFLIIHYIAMNDINFFEH